MYESAVMVDNFLQTTTLLQVTDGATDTVLAVSALALDTGDYVFRTVGDTSCALSTFHVDNEIAPLPYIALTVDGLWCPLPGTYQWFLNGSLVLGATDAYYDPAENGTYTVQLTNAQGCSTISYPFDWYSTGIMPNAAQGDRPFRFQRPMPLFMFRVSKVALRSPYQMHRGEWCSRPNSSVLITTACWPIPPTACTWLASTIRCSGSFGRAADMPR
ncbi:MAG: hypothetical protein IPO90_08535 [Flavobacteriales bacterium]|nr:hypothetical protein [Flavobacteriales bacterium]